MESEIQSTDQIAASRLETTWLFLFKIPKSKTSMATITNAKAVMIPG